ncbi:MAG: glycolate oxidase subunit GlcE [Alphaproteobacteria bacterium]|nr:glycolate oxidase subunit GlcE [Alphaproteobacteria bacterium]
MSRFRPTDEKQLVDIVAAAVAGEQPLEVVAGGSKRGLGRPLQLPHTLDVTGFSGIRQYEPEELVLTAGAATPLTEIERALTARRQMLAFEPGDWRAPLGSSATDQTLGGVIACNLAGPRRIRQGAARDHFLGVAAVSGRGEAFKAGGRVVKNVTGYDLCKLLAGSYGTLAVMTEVTVKVLPAPEATRSVVFVGLDDARAVAAMIHGLNSSHELSGAAHLPKVDGRARTALRVEGPAPSVEARSAALCGELKQFGAADILGDADSVKLWTAVRNVDPLAAGGRAIWRVSLAPTGAPAFLAAVRGALDIDYILDWGGGLVWLAVQGAQDGGAGPIRAALGGRGNATLVRAPLALRAAVPIFEPLPPAVAALTARVKDSFDPKRILNRGRLYPDM